MSHRWDCPTRWQAEREGERAHERSAGSWSNPYREEWGREHCREAERSWEDGRRCAERREEERCEERRAEQRQEEAREHRWAMERQWAQQEEEARIEEERAYYEEQERAHYETLELEEIVGNPIINRVLP